MGYLEEKRDSYFRKGYQSLRGVEGKSVLSPALDGVERVDRFVGVSTNNNTNQTLLGVKHRTYVERLEERAQKEFNKEYQERIEELNKLRVSESLNLMNDNLRQGISSEVSREGALEEDGLLGDGFEESAYANFMSELGDDFDDFDETEVSEDDDDFSLLCVEFDDVV